MSIWESPPQSDPVVEDAQGPPAAAGATGEVDDANVLATEGGDADGRRAGDESTRLAQVPLADHPAIFERIHADLQAALADIDSA